MADEVDSLLDVLELKNELRSGWVLRGIDGPESVAAHTWGTATLCLLYAERAGVDRGDAIAMALLHDLGEARTGDVPTRAERGRQDVSPTGKAAAERNAVTDLLDPFDDGDLLSRWEAYEARESRTATFVKDMDLIDNCLQALKYELGDRYDETEANEHFSEYDDLDEFFATAAPRLRTELGEELFERVVERYEEALGRACQL